MLTGEGDGGGDGCVRGLWDGGSGEALLDSLFDFSSALWVLERQRSRNGV